MSRWQTEKCFLYSNSKHSMYLLRSGVHLQYNNQCRDLYILCCCLCSRIYLSIHGLYCNVEQGLFSLYCVSSGDKEKCYLYSNSKHRMYCLCSRIHLQYNNECRHLYNLCPCLYHRNHLSIHGMYCNDE